MLKEAITTYIEDTLRQLPTTSPEILYHYTDSLGLKAIIENRNLWLSDVFSMNDPSEIKHGVNISRQQLEIALKDGVSEKDKEKSKGITDSLFKLSHDLFKNVANYFICCFSKTGDDLGQWRSYAADGHGYALGFDGAALDQFFCKDLIEHNHSFYIEYDEQSLQTWHLELAKIFCRYIATKTPAMKIEHSDYVGYMLGVLMLSLLHKHPGYINEQEYRFLQIFPHSKTVPNIKHRTRQNKKGDYSLVGYRDFSWALLEPCPLKQIIIGPAANFEYAKAFAEDCLKLYNFDLSKIEIIRSAIPYRS